MPIYHTKLFLAKRRSITQDETARTASIFESKGKVLGNLFVVNDESLAPGFSLSMNADEGVLILIPLIGQLYIKGIYVNDKLLSFGKIMSFSGKNMGFVTVINTIETTMINFLQIRIDANDDKNIVKTYPFNLEQHKNKLINVLHTNDVKICMGKFQEHATTLFNTNNKYQGILGFVVDGSFEIDGRALYQRDAIAIWDAHEMKIEATGSDSILLLIQLPINHT